MAPRDPEAQARAERAKQAAAGAVVGGAAVGTAGAAATPGAVAFAGVPVTAVGAAALTTAAIIKLIEEAFAGFQVRRSDDIFDMILALSIERYPDRPEAERLVIVDHEREREEEFQRRARERMRKALERAFKEPDQARREAAIARALEAEKRYAIAREEAVITRAISRQEQFMLRESSPAGAFWALSPYVRQHTPDCIAMAGRWWPWAVLDRVSPPMHHGCACSLWSLDEAKERGLLPDSFAPPRRGDTESILLAKRLLKDYPDVRQQLDEALEEAGYLHEAGYREFQHPRDRLGRWLEVFNKPPSVKDVVREMGGYEMVGGQQHHPELYEVHPRSGVRVRRMGAPETKMVPSEDKRPMVAEFVPGPHRMGEEQVSESRPLKYAFRAVSEEDYQGMLRRGYMQSDERMNLSAEGTVASKSNPIFYLPGGLQTDEPGDYPGRILKIELRDEDEWIVDEDSYLKTQKPIPMDRIVDVSPQIIRTKGDVDDWRVWWPSSEPAHPAEWERNEFMLRWRELPDDTEVWVYHATRPEVAAEMLANGIDPEGKPRTLARERYEAGEPSIFAPGAGLGGGLYVGREPMGVSGYGHTLLAVKVPKRSVEPSPEQVALGANETWPEPMEAAGQALSVGDAMVHAVIPPENVREVPIRRSAEGYALTPTLEDALAVVRPKPKEEKRKRLPQMSAKQVGRLLGQHGYERIRQKGSHAIYRQPGGGPSIPVPMHQGNLPLGTLKSVLASAGLREAELDQRDQLDALTEAAFEARKHPRDRVGRFRRVWHVTDKPDFALDPKYRPANNTVLGGSWPEPGLFASGDIEPWFNQYDYVRPFVAEIEVPDDIEFKGYSGETFVPASRFGEAEVVRVIPIDEYVRETFRETGWIEDFESGESQSLFEPPTRFPEGYRYSGPDVREMTPEEVERHRKRVREYIAAVRPHMLRDPFEEASYEEDLHPRNRLGRWVRKLGFPAWEVGGAPRDTLLGKTPKDIDYMLMAAPEQIKQAVEDSGHRAEDLTVRDRLVGVRAFGPELPEEGVELAPPRVEVSTGPERQDFEIRPHPEVTPSQVPDDQRAYVAEGAMKRGGFLGRRWHIPVGKTEDDRPLGRFGPKAQEASAFATEAAGFPVTVVATTYWAGEEEGVHASADRMQKQINVRPDTDDLTILHETGHLVADEEGHGPNWVRATKDLYERYLGAEAAKVFGDLLLPDAERAMADDAMRRDFTLNALYVNAETGEMIDPTGQGQSDAERKLLRTTSPDSFRDDPLRILRGLRFISQHGLELHPDTREQMVEHADAVSALTTSKGGVSGTAQEELNKLLLGREPGRALRTARDTGVLHSLFPELRPMIGFDQKSRYHDLTVDEHTFSALDQAAEMNAPLEVRLALLFHDSGKPESAWEGPDGRLHYYERPAVHKTVKLLGKEHEVVFAEVHGMQTSTRVFAAFAPPLPLGVLTVDEETGTAELIKVEDDVRRQGLATSLLEVARRETGLPLTTDTGVRSPAGEAFAAATGFQRGGKAVELTQEEADARGARLMTGLHGEGVTFTQAGEGSEAHEVVGARIAGEALTRLNYPGKTKQRVRSLIENHMLQAGSAKKRPRRVRQLRSQLGDELTDMLLTHRRADMGSKGEDADGAQDAIRALEDFAAEVEVSRHRADPTNLKDLAVTGSNLIEWGVPPGPMIGQLLQEVLDRVLADPTLNRESWIKSYIARRVRQLQVEEGVFTRHKQTPTSFRDRMEGMGHGRLPYDFDPRKHPRNRRGRFIEVLTTLQPARHAHEGDVVDVKATPFAVEATKKGYITLNTDTGEEREFATPEEVAEEVEHYLVREQSRRELERSRAEREASQREREERRREEERERQEREGETASQVQAEFDARYPRDENGLHYFYRLESPTQSEEVARQQAASLEVWGRPPQNTFAGSEPKVQAYMGRLPEGARGIEFVTTVPPDEGLAPGHGEWSPKHGVRTEGGYAKLPVRITLNSMLAAA